MSRPKAIAFIPSAQGWNSTISRFAAVVEAMKLLDGSEESERALAYATDITDAADGSITIVSAVDPDVYEASGSGPITDISDPRNTVIIDSLEAAEERGLEILADASGELLYGDPARVISGFAEDGGFDTIYVGHRGRSGRTVQFLGSVARDIVERAKVPVTVVR